MKRQVTMIVALGLGALSPTEGITSEAARDTVHTLPKVNIHGTRILDAAPKSIRSSRLTHEEVHRFTPATVGEALVTLPGVDIVKTGPWSSRVSVRGLSGDRVLVLVDGIRMNQARGHGAEASLVSIDDIETLEVDPGAGSAQYGSSALGGVVHLVTRRSLFQLVPRGSFETGLRLRGPGKGWSGTTRFRAGSSHWGLELAGGLGGLGTLTSASGDIPNSSYREENTTLRAAARYGKQVFDVEHKHTAARDIGLPAFNNSAGGSGSFPLRGRDALRLEWSRVSPGWVREARLLGDVQTFETQFEEATVESVFVRRRFVGTAATDAKDNIHSTSRGLKPTLQLKRISALGNVRLFGELRFEASSGPHETFKTIYDRQGTPTATINQISESVPDSRRSSWAAGLDLDRSLLGLQLQAAARYDQITTRADSTAAFASVDLNDIKTSLSASVSRQFRRLQPYVHVASGFRVANLDERFFNGFIHGSLFLFGNPELRPENSASYELGLKWKNAGNGIVEEAHIAAYRSYVEDLISFRFVGQLFLVPRFQYVNIRRARLDGVEASVRLRRGKSYLTLSAGAPDGIDRDTGERISDVGPSRLSMVLSLPLPEILNHGRFTTRMRWSGSIDDLDESLQRESFFTTTMEVAWQMAGFQSAATVKNVFNQDYQEPLSFIPEAGRIFTVSMRRKFNFPFN